MKFLCGLILSLTFLYGTNTFTIVTESYPPFNYEKDGKIKGISTLIIDEIQKRVGVSYPKKLIAWNRAFTLTKNKPGYILYTIAHDPHRDSLFKWVGPILSNPAYFYKKKGSSVTINTFEDAKKVRHIGIDINTKGHAYLKNRGFTNVTITPDTKGYYKGLELGRLDLIMASRSASVLRAKSYGIDPSLFESTGVVAYEQELYIAFSYDTPDNVIHQWQKALYELKIDPLYSKLIAQGAQEAKKDFDLVFDLF